MAVTTTSRFGVYRWSAGGDSFTRSQMDTSHSVIESKGAIYVQGVYASRPAAGTEGRFYFATDTSQIYYDNGTSWSTMQSDLSINPQTTAYTIALSDVGKVVTIDSTSNLALTVPKNSVTAFPVGSQITVIRKNTGNVTITPVDVDVTINGTPGLILRARYSAATLIKLGTNEWIAVGDVSA